ncbi:DinB family protein [Rugosimonospora acidiphila]|uniref:DinB family protein n=2 Tax=Rugosimonospora acidiphila TaxID=556531 RepID=A0ABP9SUM6_9ACTN
MGRIKGDLLLLSDFGYGRLRDRLAGLGDEEYLWEPAGSCWSVRPVGDGTYRADQSPTPPDPPPLTTIAWRMCHLIGVLAARRNATWLGVEPLGRGWRGAGEPGTADEAVRRLGLAYTRFRGHLAAVDAATLGDPMGEVAGGYGESSRASFVLHELDELIHHGAEIAALRDLYRATGTGRGSGA